MYWIYNARNQNEEGPIGTTLSESEAERWLNIFVRSGYCPYEIRIQPTKSLRRSSNKSENHGTFRSC
jgi:hypothetical protein